MRKSFNPNAIHTIDWPVQHCLALSTTRIHPFALTSASDNSATCSYAGFNLGLHVGDEPQQVQANRNSLAELLPKGTNIQWLQQVHGTEVVTVDAVQQVPPCADALITRQRHIALAIMTADCLPLLLSAPDGSEIAAIHCGWRPLAQNIIQHTLAKMQTPAAQLHAWLGPCIGKAAFEVGAEVPEQFAALSAKYQSAFMATDAQHYQADLPQLAVIQLRLAGVNKLHQLNDCTYSDSARYYSYRREHHTGRMATVICRT